MPSRFCLAFQASFILLLGEPSFKLSAAELAPAPRKLVDLDEHLQKSWKSQGIRSAHPADDPAKFRRLMLDLLGRVPTPDELKAFTNTTDSKKWNRTVDALLASPEFDWHFATVLDEIIQGRFAGSEPFLGYLRQALRERRGWDGIFREVMIGPWTSEASKPAIGYLDKRARDIDTLTTDTTRAFFGVDISCARCHNHPLVKDWKRNHYYGIAAFFARTTGGKGSISEKSEGEAKFPGPGGAEVVSPLMYLNGRIVDQPKAAGSGKPPAFNRREALVRVALEDPKFFSQAFVNRLWDYFFGRGLVAPVDQIHSGNPPSIPTLLEELAADFASHNYDIRRLIGLLVQSQAYRLESRWAEGDLPDAGLFAVARLRPLSPRQYARAAVLATGDGTVPDPASLDKQAAELLPFLDPRTPDFQSSTREALFASNAEPLRKIIAGGGSSLVNRLRKIESDERRIQTAFDSLYSRRATTSELADLTKWLQNQPDRQAACEDLIWALLTAGEFRFNH